MRFKGGRLLVTATVTEGNLLLRATSSKGGTWEERGRFLRWSGPLFSSSLVVTGIGPENARRGLSAAMEELEEVTAVVGFGLAGGLVKSGERGDLLIPTTIGWNSAKELPTEWLRMALAAGARGRIWRELITIPELISSKAEKSALFAATDAEGVDMESGAWGALCRERKVPWAVVRSILDPAHETLPPELLQIPDRFGRSSLARAVPHFLKNPGLIRQAWDVSGDRLARSTAPMTDLLVSWLRTGA